MRRPRRPLACQPDACVMAGLSFGEWFSPWLAARAGFRHHVQHRLFRSDKIIYGVAGKSASRWRAGMGSKLRMRCGRPSDSHRPAARIHRALSFCASTNASVASPRSSGSCVLLPGLVLVTPLVRLAVFFRYHVKILFLGADEVLRGLARQFRQQNRLRTARNRLSISLISGSLLQDSCGHQPGPRPPPADDCKRPACLECRRP